MSAASYMVDTPPANSPYMAASDTPARPKRITPPAHWREAGANLPADDDVIIPPAKATATALPPATKRTSRLLFMLCCLLLTIALNAALWHFFPIAMPTNSAVGADGTSSPTVTAQPEWLRP